MTFLSSLGSLGSSRRFSSYSTIVPALGEAALFLVRELLDLGVFAFDQHLLGLAQALFDLFPLAVFLDHRGKIGVRARELLVARRIAQHFGRRELRGQFFVARLDLVEFFK